MTPVGVGVTEVAFEYANRTGRPSGPVIRTLARVLPGVGRVQDQVAPYAAAWRAANLDALTRPGARWIVLGDSMSQGVGASSFDAGWVNQVGNRLEVGYNIINLSASGARVEDVLDVQLPAWQSLPARTGDDGRPDLVTVLIGSNDLMRRSFRDALPDRYRQLLLRLPRGAIVATLPNPRRAAALVNQLIEGAAAAGRIRIADMRVNAGSSWKGRLAEDHFHPNDVGYTDLADVFFAAITSADGSHGAGHQVG